MAGFSTELIHGADSKSRVPDVTPPINVSTTYSYDKDPTKLVKFAELKVEDYPFDTPYYSRFSHPNSINVEETVSKITGGHAVAYSSGLGAFFAIITYLNPKKISFGKGYHGCLGIVDLFVSKHGVERLSLEDADLEKLGPGDVVHLETPVNPEGLNSNIKYYAEKAHAKGALLIVDATFAPPPLQDPFKFGADYIIHSATKYFGGHSDLLAGFIITKHAKDKVNLFTERLLLGTNIANLESALLLRSLKTLDLRVRAQSKAATEIVKYLVENKEKLPKLKQVFHGSLQTDAYIKEQMPIGHSPVFSITVTDEETARHLPSKLKYFHHATSLGGVESLIEWRAISDSHVDPALLRVSIGIENVEDLIEDLANALS